MFCGVPWEEQHRQDPTPRIPANTLNLLKVPVGRVLVAPVELRETKALESLWRSCAKHARILSAAPKEEERKESVTIRLDPYLSWRHSAVYGSTGED